MRPGPWEEVAHVANGIEAALSDDRDAMRWVQRLRAARAAGERREADTVRKLRAVVASQSAALDRIADDLKAFQRRREGCR